MADAPNVRSGSPIKPDKAGKATSAACSSYVSTISARWAAGIACVEIQRHEPGRKRVFLRLDLNEARRLRDELDAVIVEREPDA